MLLQDKVKTCVFCTIVLSARVDVTMLCYKHSKTCGGAREAGGWECLLYCFLFTTHFQYCYYGLLTHVTF